MRFFSLILLLSFFGGPGKAQEMSLYQKHSFVQNNDTLPYRLLLPDNYDARKKYPLILFLHGSGERGNDNAAQLIHGGKLFARDDVRKRYPAIVVFPQCPENSFWSSVKFGMDPAGKRQFVFDKHTPPSVAMQLLNGLLAELLSTYRVQKNQVYVGGLSMGGMGTFELVWRNPKTFAAAIPICGGGDPTTAKAVRKTDWWVFHGAKDDVVPPAYSDSMVVAFKAAKVPVKYTVYSDANHNSWDPAFAEPELLKWLFAQSR